MAKCPNCGKVVDKPDKSLKNSFFNIQAYTCDKCFKHFKETK